jgi:hypothetical protein
MAVHMLGWREDCRLVCFRALLLLLLLLFPRVRLAWSRRTCCCWLTWSG